VNGGLGTLANNYRVIHKND